MHTSIYLSVTLSVHVIACPVIIGLTTDIHHLHTWNHALRCKYVFVAWTISRLSQSRNIYIRYTKVSVLDHFATKLLFNKEDFVRSNQSLAHFRSNSISSARKSQSTRRIHGILRRGTEGLVIHGSARRLVNLGHRFHRFSARHAAGRPH